MKFMFVTVVEEKETLVSLLSKLCAHDKLYKKDQGDYDTLCASFH